MKVEKILFDVKFEKKFSKYKARITEKDRENLKEKFKIFKENIFDERLKTHKLQGNLKDYYSFRITYKDRIKFKLLADGKVYLYDIGNHDLVY